MRLTIVSRIYRPEPSAASNFLGAVADAATDAGHTVTVLTAKPPRHLASQGRGKRGAQRGTQNSAWRGSAADALGGGETVKTFPVLRDKTGYVRGYAQYMSFDIPLFFRLLFHKKPDVLYVEPPPTTGAVVRVICALRRIPYVYDTADLWSEAAVNATGSKLVLRVLRALESFALRGADHATTISEGVRVRLARFAPKLPVTVVGFGANTESFKYTPAPVEKHFVYAGTYSDIHGAEVFVQAFAEFSRQNPGYRLTFVGNGTVGQTLEECASSLGIADRFAVLAPITEPELQQLLSGSLCSLASLKPGVNYDYAFATKIYSAIASGCPVIFAGIGPTVDFITEAKDSVKIGEATAHDAAAVAAAMQRLAADPLTPAERQQLAAWTDQQHSLKSSANRVLSVIMETLKNPRRR